MSAQETELIFRKCPSCRSLVPATARRCRMCGESLSPMNQEGGDSEEEQAPSKSRVRQRTTAVSEEALDSVRTEAEPEPTPVEEPVAPQVSEPPAAGVEETARFTSPVDALFSSTQTAGSGFQAGGFEQVVTDQEAEPQTSSVPPPASDEESDEDFIRRISEAARSLRGEDDVGSQQNAEAPAQQKNEITEEAPAESRRGSKSQVPSETETNDEAAAEAPKKKRKRRRRKRKKSQVDLEAAEVAEVDEPKEPQEPEEAEQTMVVEAPQVEATKEEERAKPAKATEPEVEEPQEEKVVETRPKEKRSKEKERQEPMSTPESKKKRQAVDMISKPAEPEEGGLIGWFVHYDEEGLGEAVELRTGRFFVCSERLKETDLVLEDESISTPHCVVKSSYAEGLQVQDLLSETGTFVKRSDEDKFFQYEDSVFVRHGDWVRFGNHEVLVCLIQLPRS